MRGENFRGEYKYPIKVFRIWKFDFSNGLEVRKAIVFSIVLVALMLFFMLIVLLSNLPIMNFLLSYGLVVLFLVPVGISMTVFGLKYDEKPVVSFLRDRLNFYRTKYKKYEHYDEVDNNQFETELEFEPYWFTSKEENTNASNEN